MQTYFIIFAAIFSICCKANPSNIAINSAINSNLRFCDYCVLHNEITVLGGYTGGTTLVATHEFDFRITNVTTDEQLTIKTENILLASKIEKQSVIDILRAGYLCDGPILKASISKWVIITSKYNPTNKFFQKIGVGPVIGICDGKLIKPEDYTAQLKAMELLTNNLNTTNIILDESRKRILELEKRLDNLTTVKTNP